MTLKFLSGVLWDNWGLGLWVMRERAFGRIEVDFGLALGPVHLMLTVVRA